MKVSYNWLKEYFDEEIPEPKKIAELLTMHAFEVESLDPISNDTVIEIKVLPDRSHDCLSHIGIAREIALLCNVKLKPNIFTKNIFPESNLLRVEVEDSKACPRLSALMIEDVDVKESPMWLVERLHAIGQRSINNIVDATNYVMFSLGQPLHAYDRERLKEVDGGWKLGVRMAQKGEKVFALDDKEYVLEDGELVIVDGHTNAPLGIAGIKGGKASQISKNTKNIILEAANFDPVLVRQTAKRLGSRTDASIRFENEITPELTTQAFHAVTALIIDIAKGENTRVEGLCDVYSRRANLYTVGVSLSEIQNVLGIDISQKEVEEILNRRGYPWKYVNPREEVVSLAEKYIGVPYKFGSSVLCDSPQTFDCSSFSAYLYAQAGVAIPRMSNDQYLFGIEISEEDVLLGDEVFFLSNRDGLAAGAVGHNGIYIGNGEMIHAGGFDKGYRKVVKEKIIESKYFDTGFKGYRRLLSDEEERFVVTVPSERLDLRIKEDLIEEVGRIHGYYDMESKAIDIAQVTPEIHKKSHYGNVVRNFFVERGFFEVVTYVFQEQGSVELENPIASDKKYLRQNLTKGMEDVLSRNIKNAELLGLEQIKIFEIGNIFKADSESTSLAFALDSAKEYKGKKSEGEAEQIILELAKVLGVPVDFDKGERVFEIEFDLIVSALPDPAIHLEYKGSDGMRFAQYSQYPFILRDIAVFVPKGGNQGDILTVVLAEAKGLLQNGRLLESNYTKEFPEGKKTSYAYRLVFQSLEKTLSDDEINPIMDRVTKILNNKPGWQVR